MGCARRHNLPGEVAMEKEVTPEQRARIKEYMTELPKAVIENLKRNVRFDTVIKEEVDKAKRESK
jgi:hypothetical protein